MKEDTLTKLEREERYLRARGLFDAAVWTQNIRTALESGSLSLHHWRHDGPECDARCYTAGGSTDRDGPARRA